MSESKMMDESFDMENEETYLEASGSAEEILFDETVGALEDILMCDDEFNAIQNGFFDEHCEKFSDEEENRVEYTAIFEDYTALMEEVLIRKLSEKVVGFNMHAFELQLIDRKDEIGGDIFDLLLSFSDFSEFKSLIIAHKLSKLSGAGPQFGDLLVVSHFNG